jgi:hypothetical protein
MQSLKTSTIILTTALLLAGCSFGDDFFEKEKVQNETVNKIEENIFSNIEENLGNSNIQEIQNTPQFELPSNIHETQLKKFFQLGDIYFATVIKQVFWYNLELPKKFKRPYFSGILFAKNGDTKWKIFLQVFDNPERNIPIYLWNKEGKFFMPIADDNGGGSGEGQLKLLMSNDFGKTWNTEKCFYAVGIDDMNGFSEKSIENHEKFYLEEMRRFEEAQKNKEGFKPKWFDDGDDSLGYFMIKYPFNKEIQKFEHEQDNEKTIAEWCHNFTIDVYPHLPLVKSSSNEYEVKLIEDMLKSI